MRLFSCKLRLKSSLHNEVQKIGVSAAEIMVLRHVHCPGDEVDPSTVVDIKAAGEITRTDAEERARLAGLYDVALKKQGKSIATMFGVGVPLPKVVEGLEDGTVSPEEAIERVTLDAPKRGPGRPKNPIEPKAEAVAAG